MATGVGSLAMANQVGAVYTMTNDPKGNAVIVYGRASNGLLTQTGSFPTGGTSIGAFATGNQNGILLSDDSTCLWAVNSMSNSIASFTVDGAAGTMLTRTAVIPSGGTGPVSLTQHGNWLYVLHDGSLLAGTMTPPPASADNITGFTINSDCSLAVLTGSTQSLSQVSGTFPAQVSFNPAGNVMVVTEKVTGKIDTWIVGGTGLLSGAKFQASAVSEPFGFAFNNKGDLFITEADCHTKTPPGVLPGCIAPPDHPTLASYSVAQDGTLTLIDSSTDNQAAKCWIVITDNQQYAFTVNALAIPGGGGSGNPPGGSVTSYRIDARGKLTDLGSTPVPDLPVGVPVDAALTRNSRFLYVLSEGDGTITGYHVGLDGSLEVVGAFAVTSSPAILVGGPFPNGLAAQ